MKKIIIITVSVVIAALITIKLFSNKSEADAKTYKRDPNAKILVTTSKVSFQNLYEEKKYVGTISANRDNKIASETSGKVVHVEIKEGDFIGKSNVIAKVDDTMLKLQLEAAEVQLEGIMLDVQRYENLSKGDAIPAIQLEKVNISRRSTEIQIKTLKEQISRTTIRSPFAGVVTAKFFDLGSVIAPGVPLLQLTDIDVLKLNLNIPENEISRFREGTNTQITCDVYKGVLYNGIVSMVGSKGDDSHNFPVQITVNNMKSNALKPGMFGSVSIGNSLSTSSTAIPVGALVGTIKEPKVYKIENGKAVLKNITIGLSTGSFLEVTNGLSVGDEIVIIGQVNLYDGAPVNIISNLQN